MRYIKNIQYDLAKNISEEPMDYGPNYVLADLSLPDNDWSARLSAEWESLTVNRQLLL